MNFTRLFASAAFAAVTCLAQSDLALPHIAGTVFSAAGTTPDDIRKTVDDFRLVTGAAVNPPGSPGSPLNRRDINWDGVPDALSAPGALPPDFFNKNSARGAVFSSQEKGWVGFQVSGKAGITDVRFDNFLAGYSEIFKTFSAERLFSSTGSHVYDVDFFIPGTQDRGSVHSFGAVFTNVAIPTTSSMEYFTADGVSLGKYYVRVSPKGLSFLGVSFPGSVIAKVRITPGTAALGTEDKPAEGVNIVVLDDFLYSEPVKK
ncbi:hypothetical protein F183_A09980 [Bryobacterales bacterium F-183]|nr:hypothetical protein F183_A09980 [Bryobacterales bacterium F-183]